MRKIGELLGIGFARDNRFEERTAARPKDVTDHSNNLDVRILQRLLNALRVTGNLAHQLLSVTRLIAKLFASGRREAALDQTVREQIGDPHCIVHIGRAPRNVTNMHGIREQQVELAFKARAKRDSNTRRRLYGHFGAARNCGFERAHLVRGTRCARDPRSD